jgi:hypothetical protein
MKNLNLNYKIPLHQVAYLMLNHLPFSVTKKKLLISFTQKINKILSMYQNVTKLEIQYSRTKNDMKVLMCSLNFQNVEDHLTIFQEEYNHLQCDMDSKKHHFLPFFFLLSISKFDL